MHARLRQLRLYPLKSAAAVAVQQWPVSRRGLVDDRRWMVVKPDGQFLTARLLPQLLALRLQGQAGHWSLHLPDGYSEVLQEHGAETMPVRIWNDNLRLPQVNPELAERLSRWLGTPCRLVCLPDQLQRPVKPQYARAGDEVSLADGFPLLLTRAASLEALNQQLPRPVSMDRFRANVVLEDDGPAWQEESWRKIRIGEVVFRLAKPCTRCVMVNTDPERATRDPDLPVLQTLKQFHANEKGEALFGMNLIPENTGRLQVGDPVEILA